MKTVSLIRYTEPGKSVREAVEMVDGLKAMPRGARVFIKPNIVFWTAAAPFPKWGVITTSRVVEDTVAMLKDQGAGEIIIGEGAVLFDLKDKHTMNHAFDTLGYTRLAERYGVKVYNVFERPFRKVNLGDGVELSFSADILDSDFVVDLPVLKTHAQTVVSLGIKNLKGTIDIPSRKACHSADEARGLHYKVARLADPMPPMLTIIDGLFTNERGPSFDGRIKRADLLLASTDVLSADLAGARILGYRGDEVPHLAFAAANRNRPTDLSDVEVKGLNPDDFARRHEYTFPYNQSGTLPLPMEKNGVKGLVYKKYDSTLCTYCSGLNGAVLTSIGYAYQGNPFDEIEVLTGKAMQPTPGMKHTILLGKCMSQAHKDNPDIAHKIAIKGCPPDPKKIVEALHEVGIMVNPALFENLEQMPGFFLSRYEGKPEYDENLFRVE